jgi:hypothetical protein
VISTKICWLVSCWELVYFAEEACYLSKGMDPLNRQGGDEGRPLLHRLLGSRLIDVEFE